MNKMNIQHQSGVTLIELMVGIAIGLLVVAVAMVALMASRGISGTVSDVSNMQQQATYALRVIGTQLRQTGSLYLNLNPQNIAAGSDELIAVGLELSGAEGPAIESATGSIHIGYTRYQEPVFISDDPISLARNCLGGPTDSSTDNRIDNLFSISGTTLMCAGNGTAAQPIISNVRAFEIRYLQQDNTIPGDSRIIYATSATADAWGPTDWEKVQGVEICLVLFGNEMANIQDGATYKSCDGTTDEQYTDNKMHLVFRNVFQLRSQGLISNI